MPVGTNPLDFVPDKIPFDTPYRPPISLDRAEAVIHAAVAEAQKRDWKMNVAVIDSGGDLVAFQRMDGAMLASIRIAEHEARAAATFRRETKFFEDGVAGGGPMARLPDRDGIKTLTARGFHRPGDVENRLGYYLGQIAR
jgi:uncharacterized protein GlcG (DUF336 family)